MKKLFFAAIFSIFVTAVFAQLPNNQFKFSVGKSIQGSGDFRGWHFSNDFTRKVANHLVIGVGLSIDHATGRSFASDANQSASTIYTIGGYDIKSLGANINQVGGADELIQYPTHASSGTYIIGDLNAGYVNQWENDMIKVMGGISFGYVNSSTIVSEFPASIYFTPKSPDEENVRFLVPIYRQYSNFGWNLKLEYDHYFTKNVSVGARLSYQNLKGDSVAAAGLSVGVGF